MAVKAKAQITIFYVSEVEAVYRYYLLQSSTLAKPSAPTSYPPSSSWVVTEPTYTEGSTTSLYYVDCTVLTDGTWSYSPVSLSSSYESAKLAYNKAVAALGRVTTAEADITNIEGELSLKASRTEVTTAINEIEIGGRNLFENSGNLTQSAFSGYYSPSAPSVSYNVGLDTSVPSGQYLSITLTDVSSVTTGGPYIISSFGNFLPKLVDGETYTVSVWVKCSTAKSIGAISVEFLRNKINVSVPSLSTEWQKYVITGTYSADTTASAICFYYGSEWAENDIFYVSSLKLEKGNKATDWTPAPEDQQSAIDTAAGNLNASIGDIQANLDTTNSNLSDLQTDYNATYEIVTENSTKISELLQTADGWTMSFETLNTTVTELNGKLTSEVNERYEYIRFENGDIYLGKRPEAGEDDLQLVISNEKISFNLNGSEVAYFSDDALYVTTVHVTKALRFGNFEFAERSNGNMGLRWVGES